MYNLNSLVILRYKYIKFENNLFFRQLGTIYNNQIYTKTICPKNQYSKNIFTTKKKKQINKLKTNLKKNFSL